MKRQGEESGPAIEILDRLESGETGETLMVEIAMYLTRNSPAFKWRNRLLEEPGMDSGDEENIDWWLPIYILNEHGLIELTKLRPEEP